MAESKQKSAFQKGDSVVYTSNSGATNVAVILKVHFEDDPPFYTIHITETGIEKQTDEKNLIFLPLIEEEEEDGEDDLSPPPAPRPARRDKGAVARPNQWLVGGLLSLGAAGVAALGMLLLTYSKHVFKRRF